MRYWGITGTNGKTTCTWIAAAFIDAMPSRRCGYVTTVEVWTGARRFYTGYTTPPLAQLKEIFAEMEANGCTDCVMEVSSHAIHQHRTGDTVFAGGAFTNLTEDHLDYHKTMAAYFDVKLDFARQIAAAWKERTTKCVSAAGAEQTPLCAPHLGRSELAPYVVCLDGGNGREMFEAVGNLPLNVIPVHASEGEGANQPNYDLSALQLAGAYNRSNVLVAAALAEAAGASHDVIQRVIPTLKPRWGRLERVENPQVKATVYVDFAHTPDGLEKVLTAVRGEMVLKSNEALAKPVDATACRVSKSGSRHLLETRQAVASTNAGGSASLSNNPTIQQSNNSLWVVFGAGGDRDPMKRPLMGAACARLADRLVVTSDNPRSEDPMKIIEAIVGGVSGCRGAGVSECRGAGVPACRGAGVPGCYVEPDRAKAIGYALSEAAEGDVIVIAGKGHETTQEIKGVKYPFDDREIVRAWSR